MKNLILILLVALISFSTSNIFAQSEKTQIPTSAINTETETVSTVVNINAAELKVKMQDEDIVILDVRTPVETAQGVIEGAIEIDVKASDFTEKIQKLDKDKTYLVYCRSGRRSVAASEIMEKEGFAKLYNLLGGYNAWSQ